jgi:hypothetical protein
MLFHTFNDTPNTNQSSSVYTAMLECYMRLNLSIFHYTLLECLVP